ncbi:MAG TPA: zinc ribbon domain-containing protein, partial [Anaerolineae bacterium]|nr:zinc ribbon domain-containing protein [Anaerolineae bacterium]
SNRYEVEELSFEILEPARAHDLKGDPPLGEARSSDAGFRFYERLVGALPKGESTTQAVYYTKPDNLPSVEQPLSTESPLSVATPVVTKVEESNQSFPWVPIGAGGLFLAGVVIIGYAWWSGHRVEAGRRLLPVWPHRSGQAGSRSDPETAAAFCHQCGAPFRSGDRFCSQCGAPRRGIDRGRKRTSRRS